MSGITCLDARPRLPELGSARPEGRAPASLQEHVAACPDCRAELQLVEAIRAIRPEPPARLGLRVRRAVRADLRWRGRSWSWTAAAAVAALALGLSVLWDRTGPPVRPTSLSFDLEPAIGIWPSDDGTVAGAPLLDALSEEGLASLLEELAP